MTAGLAAGIGFISLLRRNPRVAAWRAPDSSLRPLHVSADLIGYFLFLRWNAGAGPCRHVVCFGVCRAAVEVGATALTLNIESD
jgi:hypothetical protein